MLVLNLTLISHKSVYQGSTGVDASFLLWVIAEYVPKELVGQANAAPNLFHIAERSSCKMQRRRGPATGVHAVLSRTCFVCCNGEVGNRLRDRLDQEDDMRRVETMPRRS
jgi:hypothetical protein